MRPPALPIVVLVLAGLFSCQTEHTASRPAPPIHTVTDTRTPEGGLRRTEVTTARARVEGIDQARRLVTLRLADGDVTTVKVDGTVRNLPQVRKGDDVVATYYESVAVRLRQPGDATAGISSSEQRERTSPGEKPSTIGTDVVTLTSTVEKIDRKKQTATLRGPGGDRMTVNVHDPTLLEKVQDGDLVELTFTRALAIGVEKPGSVE